MAKFKMTNVAELSVEDLRKKLADLESQLLRQRAQIAKGAAIENPSMVREIRRNIARIKQRLEAKAK